MKLFPLVNHCNRPPPTKEFCNYLVKSVFFFTGFAPESHWVCKSGGLYISYQYLLTGSQSHLVLFGEKQVLFYFLCQYGRLQNPGETKPHGMKMEKVCQLLVANFKESCGGETFSFSLCKYFSENIQTRDKEERDYKYHLPLLGACEESSFAPSVCFNPHPSSFQTTLRSRIIQPYFFAGFAFVFTILHCV